MGAVRHDVSDGVAFGPGGIPAPGKDTGLRRRRRWASFPMTPAIDVMNREAAERCAELAANVGGVHILPDNGLRELPRDAIRAESRDLVGGKVAKRLAEAEHDRYVALAPAPAPGNLRDRESTLSERDVIARAINDVQACGRDGT